MPSNPELTYYSNNPQWHMFGKAGAPVKDAILAARDRVLARYPKLRVVGCHLGSDEDDLKRLAKRLDAYPNFAVDTAARVRYFARGDRESGPAVPHSLSGPRSSTPPTSPSATATRCGRGASLQSTHDRDWDFFSGDG